jgi:hypothetical protein
MRVQVNNVTKGRTEVVNNSQTYFYSFYFSYSRNFADLNPVWDQIIYVPGTYLLSSIFWMAD